MFPLNSVIWKIQRTDSEKRRSRRDGTLQAALSEFYAVCKLKLSCFVHFKCKGNGEFQL